MNKSMMKKIAWTCVFVSIMCVLFFIWFGCLAKNEVSNPVYNAAMWTAGFLLIGAFSPIIPLFVTAYEE